MFKTWFHQDFELRNQGSRNEPRAPGEFMLNRSLLALGLFGMLVLAGCGTTNLPNPSSDVTDETFAPGPISINQPEVSLQPMAVLTVAQIQQQVFDLVNQARAVGRTCGTTYYPAAPALARNAMLDSAASKHSTDMATYNYFSHTGRDGSKPWDRMKREGYIWRSAGENIAAGYSSAASVMQGWLASPGHCANIMNARFKDIGIGYATGGSYRYYWTQDFGSR